MQWVRDAWFKLLLVQKSAVGAVQIFDDPTLILPADPGVPARRTLVGQYKLALRGATHRGLPADYREFLAGIWT
jgi:hypothetical protein